MENQLTSILWGHHIRDWREVKAWWDGRRILFIWRRYTGVTSFHMVHSCKKEEQKEVGVSEYVNSPESNVESPEYDDGMLELSEASGVRQSVRLIWNTALTTVHCGYAWAVWRIHPEQSGNVKTEGDHSVNLITNRWQTTHNSGYNFNLTCYTNMLPLPCLKQPCILIQTPTVLYNPLSNPSWHHLILWLSVVGGQHDNFINDDWVAQVQEFQSQLAFQHSEEKIVSQMQTEIYFT